MLEPLRERFRKIADAFVAGNFQLREHPITGVKPSDTETAEWIASNVAAHGAARRARGRLALVERPAHLSGENDQFVRIAPALERYGSFAEFLGDAQDTGEAWRALRRSEASGRPLGSAAWIKVLEE